ncbi:MAG: cell division protein FtsL [Gemmatimonadaceae bacterium]|jgi:cell division protein FtsL|nr:cell division protein FtsL [Gemmatimonadaceae bacterium]
MARRRSWSGRLGGVFAIGLLAFVAAAVIVVWRRTRGDVEQQAIVTLEAERRDLEAQRVSLERDLQSAMSAGRIEPLARRTLGLRLPSDSQIVTLVRSRGAEVVNDSSPSDRP